MLIGLGKDKNTIDVRLTRSKVKLTRVAFVKKLIMFSAHYLENCLLQRFHVAHADWYWRGHGPLLMLSSLGQKVRS